MRRFKYMGRRVLPIVLLLISGTVVVAIFAVAPVTLPGLIHALAASGQPSFGGR